VDFCQWSVTQAAQAAHIQSTIGVIRTVSTHITILRSARAEQLAIGAFRGECSKCSKRAAPPLPLRAPSRAPPRRRQYAAPRPSRGPQEVPAATPGRRRGGGGRGRARQRGRRARRHRLHCAARARVVEQSLRRRVAAAPAAGAAGARVERAGACAGGRAARAGCARLQPARQNGRCVGLLRLRRCCSALLPLQRAPLHHTLNSNNP
jgi:hypothetical protein